MKQCSELDFFQLEAPDFIAIRKQVIKSKLELAREGQYINISQLVSRLVCALVPILNEFHEVEHEAHYWGILLGCWLSYYSVIIKTHCEFLEKILKKTDQKKIKIMSLNHSDCRVPQDSSDFFYLIKEPAYHLQIYHMIAQQLGLDLEVFQDEDFPNLNPPKNKFAASKQRIFFSNIFCFLFRKRKKILLFSPYLPQAVRIKFFLRSLGAIFEAPKWLFNESVDHANIFFSKEKRAVLARELKWQPENEFEKILGRLVFSEMPMVFLESFKIYETRAQALVRQFGRVSGVLSAGGGFWENDVFKQYTALIQEQGAKVYGMQHGGNYGVTLPVVGMRYEYSIADKFFTWGWSGSGHDLDAGRFYPMTLSKQVGLPFYSKKNKRTNSFLFPLIVWPAVGEEISFESFLEDQCEFLNGLSLDLRRKTLVRPHHEDLGWGIRDRLLSNFPDLTIDSWAEPFLKRLANCELFICGHLATTHVEALAMNVPTILFWRKEFVLLSDEAEPYYEDLVRVGVLFYDPKAAAEAVNSIYPNIDQWWENKERQDAVKNVVNKFARRAVDEEKIWYRTLRSLV